MKKITTALLVAATCSLTGCDIERLPYNSMAAEEIQKDPEASLDALLTGCYAQMKDWSDVMHRCGEYAGDNIMIRGTSTDAFYEFISYSRTPQNYRLNTFWNNSYKVIAQSSNIIKMMEEGQSAKIDQSLGECYFMRGMMYFYLTRAYGRPYYQNPDVNLGVPIVNGTPDDIGNLVLPDRSTVKECYEQAVRDLEKSTEMMTESSGPGYASKEAAYALLSRVYLYMSGTWDNPDTEYARKAVEYADLVINSGKYRLLDRPDFMKYNTLTPENNSESIFVVLRRASEFSGFDHYYGIGGMYSNIGGMGWGEMYASAKHISLLDETGRNDWWNGKIVDARAAFIEPVYETGDDEKDVFRFIRNEYSGGAQVNFNYVQAEYKTEGDQLTWLESWTASDESVKTQKYTLKPVDAGQGIYTIDYRDGNTYTGVLDKFIRLNRAYPQFYIVKCSREGEDSQLHSPVITRLGEIYLNKAEASAKLGDYGNALTALNMIRERSLPGEGYGSLDAQNAEYRIEKERQLELAFQAERSYDVYRNGRSLTRLYPGPHKAMEEVMPTDYRVVYYIPQDAINAYKPNILTQNPTSN